jgi:uncharacterized protein (DUF697 family)
MQNHPPFLRENYMPTSTLQSARLIASLFMAGPFTGASLLCSAALADRFFVDGTVGLTGSGGSWESPYKSIHEALLAASMSEGPDEIWVREFLYPPGFTESDPAGAFFWIRPGTQLFGGFVGTEEFRQQRNPVDRPTVLEGQLLFPLGAACAAEGGGDCFDLSEEPGCKDIACCSIVCAIFSACCSAAWDQDCVDIALLECVPLPAAMRLVRVTEAGMPGSSRRLDGFIVRNGGSGDAVATIGGGVEVSDGELEIVRCVFTTNRAESGGAVAVTTAAEGTTIRNCRFEANLAENYGGAILIAGPMVIANCIFAGQDLTADNGQSTSTTRGGAVFDAVTDEGVTRSIVNCTFSLNKASIGGGIAASLLSGYSHQLLVHNCIVWGNTTEGGDPSEIGPGLTVKYSNVRGGYGDSSDHNIDADPEFEELTLGAINLLALQSSSPCIDAGNNALVVVDDIDVDDDDNLTEPGPDLLLTRRVQPRPGFAVPLLDMGAYELPNCECSTADLNVDGAVDGADLGAMLGAWGACPSTGECPADLNGDGEVDGADLGILLGGWCESLYYPRQCEESFLFVGGGFEESSETGLPLAALVASLGFWKSTEFAEWVATLPFAEMEFVLSLIDD